MAANTNLGEASLFDIGDKVVYPHHGAGTVVKREKREILGETREYLTIQILHNDMTVNVPCDNAERVGLRQVIDQRTVTMVVRTLSGGSTEMPKNWNRRFKHNRDKMKTGNIFELAEVVRNLAVRNNEKGLSTGEKQMFVKAKKILASELMYAKAMSEDEAAEWLDDVLSRAGQPKPKSRAKAQGSRRECVVRPGGSGEAGATWAVLVAAGAGERLGIDRPKAFASLGGRPLLAESLDRLDRSPWVDAIVVAAPAGWEEPAILLAEELAATKVVSCVTGGATRADSVRAALRRRSGGCARRARARCGSTPARRRGGRARARSARGRVRRRRSGASDPGHRQARRRRRRRGDASSEAISSVRRRPRRSSRQLSGVRCRAISRRQPTARRSSSAPEGALRWQRATRDSSR